MKIAASRANCLDLHTYDALGKDDGLLVEDES